MGGGCETRKSGVESQKLNTARGNIAFKSADCHEVPVSALSLAFIFFVRSDRVPVRTQQSRVCSPSCRCADDSAPSLMYRVPSHHYL